MALPKEFENYLTWIRKPIIEANNDDATNFMELTNFATRHYPSKELTKEIYLHWSTQRFLNSIPRQQLQNPTPPKNLVLPQPHATIIPTIPDQTQFQPLNPSKTFLMPEIVDFNFDTMQLELPKDLSQVNTVSPPCEERCKSITPPNVLESSHGKNLSELASKYNQDDYKKGLQRLKRKANPTTTSTTTKDKTRGRPFKKAKIEEIRESVADPTDINLKRLIFLKSSGEKLSKEVFTSSQEDIAVNNDDDFNLYLYIHNCITNILNNIREEKNKLFYTLELERNLISLTKTVASYENKL